MSVKWVLILIVTSYVNSEKSLILWTCHVCLCHRSYITNPGQWMYQYTNGLVCPKLFKHELIIKVSDHIDITCIFRGSHISKYPLYTCWEHTDMILFSHILFWFESGTWINFIIGNPHSVWINFTILILELWRQFQTVSSQAQITTELGKVFI